MITKRSFFCVGLGALGFGLGLFGGCGDSGSDGTGGQGPDISDVIYEGGTNDEALEALLAAAVVEDAEKVPVVTWPLDGDEMPDDEIPWFGWQPASELAQAPVQPTPHRYGRTLPPPSLQPTVVQRVMEPLLAGVRSAHAHGEPISGPGFFAVISSESEPELVRVFTTAREYLPTEEVWEKIKAVNEPITVTVTAAEFDNNRIAQEGGPWKGSSITFTIVAPVE